MADEPLGAPGRWLAWLALAATARLLLQVFAMPPYAGLDEGFHVARVAYVAAHGRQPTARELSVPRYLARSMAGELGAPPGFGTIQAGWRDLLAARPLGWKDVPLDRAARSDAVAENYEAQQASLYYAVAAPLDRAFGATQLAQLLVLRLFAVPFAVLTVLATGLLGARLWGPTGVLSGLLLIAAPSWIALVARAGNDSLACGALALGVLLSTLPDGGWGRRTAEAVSWAAAIGTKLYAWPAALLLPLLWPKGDSRARRVFVAAAAAAAAALTALDLAARTGNPIGKVEFAAAGRIGLTADSLGRLASLPWFQYFKVFVGQAIWTSGQHANFLRGLGILLFLAPWFLLVGGGLRSIGAMPRSSARLLLAAALFFAIAEAGQAWGQLRQEVLADVPSRSAGLAGWYAHAFDPIWFGVGFGVALSALRRRWPSGALALVVAATFLGDLCLTERALFRDFAGLSSPLTPGRFVRWGGGSAWEALGRLGRYGLWLPSPWIAVGLRTLEFLAAAALVTVVLQRAPPAEAPLGQKTV